MPTYGRIFVLYTLRGFFLVAKGIYRLAGLVQKLHELVLRAPHRVRPAEIDAPGVAREIAVIFVRINAPIVIEILNHEALAHSGDRDRRREDNLTARECVHIVDTGGISNVASAIGGGQLTFRRRAVLGK